MNQDHRRWHQFHLRALLVIVALFAAAFAIPHGMNVFITSCLAGAIGGAFLSQFPSHRRNDRPRQRICTVIGGFVGSLAWIAAFLIIGFGFGKSIAPEAFQFGLPCPPISAPLIGAGIGYITWGALRLARYY